jgi:DNA-binding NarL/FixJ family response regulator
MARPLNQLAPTTPDQVHSQELQSLSSDPLVARATAVFDNITGIRSISVEYRNGEQRNVDWIAPGFVETTHFDPRGISSIDRNSTVLALLGQGRTQSEVAKRLGISQSRVSQIKRENGI